MNTMHSKLAFVNNECPHVAQKGHGCPIALSLMLSELEVPFLESITANKRERLQTLKI